MSDYLERKRENQLKRVVRSPKFSCLRRQTRKSTWFTVIQKSCNIIKIAPKARKFFELKRGLFLKSLKKTLVSFQWPNCDLNSDGRRQAWMECSEASPVASGQTCSSECFRYQRNSGVSDSSMGTCLIQSTKQWYGFAHCRYRKYL